MSDQQEECTCHIAPPCSFCTSMTEDEVDIYSHYGRHALQIHRAAMRENKLKLASSEAKIADLKADAESWQKQAINK